MKVENVMISNMTGFGLRPWVLGFWFLVFGSYVLSLVLELCG